MFVELFLRITYVKIVYSIYLQAVFDPVLPAFTKYTLAVPYLCSHSRYYHRRYYTEVIVYLGSPLLDCKFLVFESLALSRGPSLE